LEQKEDNIIKNYFEQEKKEDITEDSEVKAKRMLINSKKKIIKKKMRSNQ